MGCAKCGGTKKMKAGGSTLSKSVIKKAPVQLYGIPQENMGKFYDLYVESILDQEKQYLVEKTTEIGPLRIDFDFIYSREIESHQHTRDQTLAFVKAYLKEVSEYLEIPSETKVYIMEKRKPTLDTKKNRMKSGIHIVCSENRSQGRNTCRSA